MLNQMLFTINSLKTENGIKYKLINLKEINKKYFKHTLKCQPETKISGDNTQVSRNAVPV